MGFGKPPATPVKAAAFEIMCSQKFPLLKRFWKVLVVVFVFLRCSVDDKNITEDV